MAALVAVAALIMAGCGKKSSTASSPKSTTSTTADVNAGKVGPNADGELVIGELLPQTGDLSFLGPPMFKGVELAVKQINEAGGVNGKPVRLAAGDDGGTTNNDAAVATEKREISTDKADAIVGAAGSGTTKAVIDDITKHNVVECSPSNTGDVFTTINDNGGFYFRTAPPDILQAQALSSVITGDNKSKVAIIALNDEYGQGFAKNLKTDLTSDGATVVANIAYDPHGTTYDTEVDQLVAAHPDAVALLAFPDTGGRVLTSMIKKSIGPDKLQIYVADGMQSGKLYQNVDKNNPAVTKGIKGTAPSSAPTNGTPTFTEAFKTFAPGVDSIYSAHAYDCAMVIALAATEAKSDDSVKIRAHMNDVTKDGTKCTSFKDCADLLKQGKDIDYDGAAGPLNFVDAGEPGAGSYEVYTFGADGKYATDPKQIAVGK